MAHAWLREPGNSSDVLPRITAGQSVALTVMCSVTIVAGIYPEPFIRLATYSLVLPAALFGH